MAGQQCILAVIALWMLLADNTVACAVVDWDNYCCSAKQYARPHNGSRHVGRRHGKLWACVTSSTSKLQVHVTVRCWGSLVYCLVTSAGMLALSAGTYYKLGHHSSSQTANLGLSSCTVDLGLAGTTARLVTMCDLLPAADGSSVWLDAAAAVSFGG